MTSASGIIRTDRRRPPVRPSRMPPTPSSRQSPPGTAPPPPIGILDDPCGAHPDRRRLDAVPPAPTPESVAAATGGGSCPLGNSGAPADNGNGACVQRRPGLPPRTAPLAEGDTPLAAVAHEGETDAPASPCSGLRGDAGRPEAAADEPTNRAGVSRRRLDRRAGGQIGRRGAGAGGVLEASGLIAGATLRCWASPVLDRVEGTTGGRPCCRSGISSEMPDAADAALGAVDRPATSTDVAATAVAGSPTAEKAGTSPRRVATTGDAATGPMAGTSPASPAAPTVTVGRGVSP